jgi:MFS family permease
MIFLLIEFLDELVFGVQDAAWPLIRTDLHLTYVQIGILLSLPGLIANLIEPFLFILGDVWRRRIIILGGGIFFTLALALIALSHDFVLLIFALLLFNPSSGAFVSLSQGTLMDVEPTRHEPNMARWTFAGSLGVFLGPLLLGGAIALGFGWRHAFWALAAFSTLILLAAFRAVPNSGSPHADFPSVRVFFWKLAPCVFCFTRPDGLTLVDPARILGLDAGRAVRFPGVVFRGRGRIYTHLRGFRCRCMDGCRSTWRFLVDSAGGTRPRPRLSARQRYTRIDPVSEFPAGRSTLA